ncbi:hypothetical protein BO82DRAFT_414323 [Aspergillus uvarum CBS 121591]|uniref:chitinase n=1 Tax=Aspergillus uvarum CBS 121591 TaxID=1448315 RepID=A0A319CDY2_9EURO|nr:hypothetical protein BO82DRAFT_414323 [Aspergillus uvarum CBS 121591]PYH81931.1 hypothetical protein BO82DRAFT_414323 [Aspergillus uvarum CBS 121591]
MHHSLGTSRWSIGVAWLQSFIFLSLFIYSQAQTTYYCDSETPCANGACCGVTDSQGVCGYGIDFCGDTCVSNCNATAACGKDAAIPGTTCPLNVCCSEWGFCGTSIDFCDTSSGCQSDCGSPTVPSCSSNDVYKRVIGYYEGWSSDRVCDSWSPSRVSFVLEVLRLLQTYGFDGVDLDWEYPGASDRGGKSADKENYVRLVAELRIVLDDSGSQYGISFTTPSSYWYLQNFDVVGMLDAGADWTNIMTYDLHGSWDRDDVWIGSVMLAHTNLTEIKSALDLMWRAGVQPSDIVLGIGFYGRSYTMSDIACYEPGCPFASAGAAGPCTVTAGVLSFSEIMEYMEEQDAVTIWDETDAVNYMVWEDQWVSFDTNMTFQQKVDYANGVCLGGLMIWSVDQDTYDWQALSGLLGKAMASNNLLTGGSMNTQSAEALSQDYSAYTGTDCYISDCVDWNTGQCKPGYSVLDYVHQGSYGMIEDPDTKFCKSGEEGDSDSQYRLICCPTNAMPEGCSWEGELEGMCYGGSMTCGKGKYELVADSYIDRTGSESCETSSVRSLCCNTNSALEKCSWSSCGNSCNSTDYTFTSSSPYPGPNLQQDSFKCESSDVSFCCPSEDTYEGCAWYGCSDSCPSSKVLITQRTEIFQGGKSTACNTGQNKLCCDPPSGSSSWLVDPKYLFKYPDEENVSYDYTVQASSNDEDTADASEDPFALVMIDGDTKAYDESLVDQWTFLTDQQELRKRDLKLHTRHSIFEHRNDTFENVVEVYHIQCINLFVNGTACTSVFEGGASNTIVKMPDDIGAGPYARIISLVPLSINRTSIIPRSTGDIYELTVDYDFAAAAEEQKGDVNFRIDYTNLQEYWYQITDTPSSKKRWFGAFDSWLKKMTTIVKDERGSLPLLYEETIKLYHAHEYCPAMNLEATFDIDAYIHLGLFNQYGYYFEGSILPTPEVISAYGYFSIEPTAAILLTIRANAIMQSSTGSVELFSLGFPGMSIKGLISIGPELALYGQMDASLSISGELNAGIALEFQKTEVYFPQDAAGKADSVAPADLSDEQSQTYSFDPNFDATLTAEGNMALSLTPEVRFGISVLGGDLMSGYVTAGLNNTINLGISAEASYSGGTSSAGFCYWADYVYSLFIRADMSFLDDVAYWGSEYEVASPADPLELVAKTCTTYSSDVDLSKRSDPTSLVANTTGAACFGGLMSCQRIDNSPTASGNLSCPMVCDGDSCTLLDDGAASSSRKRQATTNTAQCARFPAFFYNCAWFGNSYIPNQDQTTNTLPGQQAYLATGICANVQNYLFSHQSQWSPQIMGSNFMLLTYKPDAEDTNRLYACGTKSTNTYTTKSCAQLKRSLWSVEAQDSYAKKGDYEDEPGFSESVSCDEFPCTVAEGGSGASTACAPVEQQNYQSILNGMVSHIYDKQAKQTWSTKSGFTGYTRYFTMNLFDSQDASNPTNWLGTYAGYYDSGETLPLLRVVGGVNLFYSQLWSITSNALCHIDASTQPDLQPLLKIYQFKLEKCQIVYENPYVTGRWKRDNEDTKEDNYTGPDHLHPSLWQVKGTASRFRDICTHANEQPASHTQRFEYPRTGKSVPSTSGPAILIVRPGLKR